MPYVYQADYWCDECALDIRDRILSKRPSLAGSEDSNEWPQEVSDTEPMDMVHNCASGTCGGTDTIVSLDPGPGALVEYGAHLELPLSKEGYLDLQAKLNGHGRTLPAFAEEWARFYGFEWHENPWGNVMEWLEDTFKRLWPIGDHDALWSMVATLMGLVEPEKVEEAFVDDLEEDGFNRKQGWYSREGGV